MTEHTENRKREGTISHTGTSSLLVIFVVVVLAAFAIGTLITAENNSRMALKLADNQQLYYNASDNGEIILADIDETLEACFWQTSSEAEYYTEAENRLQELNPENTVLEIDEAHNVSYSIEISDTQALEVQLQIRYPENAGETYYRITRWQSVQTSQTNYDNTLNLFQP